MSSQPGLCAVSSETLASGMVLVAAITCHLRQRHQQRDDHDEQHCFGIRHRPLSPSNWSMIILAAVAFELRRDIAKEAALRRLGPPFTNY